MNRPVMYLAVGMLALPAAAMAQARNGNVYDSTSHQPTIGVQSQERSAGVAPSTTTIQNENRDLSAINQQLLEKAHRDAQQQPSSTNNVYGVQPGGVITSTPNAGAQGGATAR